MEPSTPRPSEIVLRRNFFSEANSMLTSILGAVEYGILLTDLNHVALAGNRRLGEIFGIDIQRVVESDVGAVRRMVESRIGDFEQWHQNLTKVYADPETIQDDTLTLMHPEVTLLRHTGPVRDEHGTPIGRLWTFLDISSRRKQDRINEVLHKTSLLYDPKPKRVYEQIVEEIGALYNAIAVLSIRRGDFMEFHAVGGPVPEARELPGNELSDSYCQFCIESSQGVIVQDASLDPKTSQLMPARFGFTRYAGVPLISPDGSIFGTLCILDNRTHEIHGEDDLRFLSFMAMRISSELEREAQLKELERDLATAQAQVIQNEKLATTGTLSAAIAHDIRNIVSAISLDIGMEPTGSREALKTVRTHLDRFNVLAHRLLSYAQPKDVVLEPTSVGDSLHRVLDLLAQHFQVAGIECEVHISPTIPLVLADSSRLDHLLLNICMNAIQAMKNSGRIAIRAAFEGSNVFISIQDNGPGMTTEQVERAFEPFHSTRHDGFGLGLYSCKQIVKDCGGTIDVQSELGVGTTFRISLPSL